MYIHRFFFDTSTLEMSNANYSASIITQRRQNKAIAGSFIRRIQNGSQSTTSYGPLQGNFDQSILNAVHEGQMKQYSKIAGTCTTVDPGCPCVGAPTIEPAGPCPLDFYWATNIVGNGNTQNGKSIAVGVCGNVYATGNFVSPTIAINSYGSSTGSGNPIITQPFGTLTKGAAESAYIVKYNVSGQVQWATRLAGSALNSTVFSNALAIDSDENVYITGGYGPGAVTIYHSNGNTFADLQSTSGVYDVFVVKYNSAGFAQWATTISGTNSEYGNGIAVDSNANVYITGYYDSNPISVNSAAGNSGGNVQVTPFITLPMSGTPGVNNSSFVVKYATNGIADWATYIDGPTHQEGISIAVDNLGYAYVTGKYFSDPVQFYNYSPSSAPTASGTFVGATTYQAFVAKYQTSGVGKGTVQWATNMTGAGTDTGLGVAADANGNVYVTGAFNSATLTINSYDTTAGPPTPTIPFATILYGTMNNTVQPPLTITYDVFVIKFATDGTALWATRIGGSNNEGIVTQENVAAITVDSDANVYVTTFSRTTQTIINSAQQPATPGGLITPQSYGLLPVASKAEVCIVKYNTNGAVQWATNIDGVQDDGLLGADIALDPNGNVHVISNYQYDGLDPGDVAITFNNFTSTPSPLGTTIGTQPYGTLNVPTPATIGTNDVFIVKYNTSGQIV